MRFWVHLTLLQSFQACTFWGRPDSNRHQHISQYSRRLIGVELLVVRALQGSSDESRRPWPHHSGPFSKQKRLISSIQNNIEFTLATVLRYMRRMWSIVVRNTNISHVRASTINSLHLSVAGCVLLVLYWRKLHPSTNGRKPTSTQDRVLHGHHCVPLTRRHGHDRGSREDGVPSEERDSTCITQVSTRGTHY